MTSPLQAIKDHYASSDRGDLAGMLRPLAPDISWTEMAGFPYAGTYTGPDSVRANVFGRLNEDWEGFRADPESFVAEGEHVVAFGVYSGVCRGTGRAVRARFVHHWEFEAGRVTRFEQYTDTALFRAAMEPAVG